MTKNSIRNFFLALAVSGLMTLGAAAQTSSNQSNSQGTMNSNMGNSAQSTSTSNNSSQLSPSAKQFLDKAAQGNEAEVKLGNLALQKATTDHLKNFAQRMVSDHGAANVRLKAVAQSKGITLPSSPNAQEQSQYDRLSKLSGRQFDDAYINTMTKDHTKDVAEYKQEMQKAQDPEVKNYVSETLPVIENHLQRAEDLAGKDLQKQANNQQGTQGTNNPPQR